ncbi:hypothetical protein [Mycolicibacterium sp. CBMA 234]|uniref:hypothetical protein n=1 Tax=Mycolicibacterium sp. CBMA 234 TaxID=1918495 RepID=UPI0012DBED22|nr:hypothetical protein [Mycolicibacterium sp. CBMA 234]
MSHVASPRGATGAAVLVAAVMAATVTPASAAPADAVCPGSPITAHQFVGDWTSEPYDAFYVPLHATRTQLEVSYVGRGNTPTWVRAAGQ